MSHLNCFLRTSNKSKTPQRTRSRKRKDASLDQNQQRVLDIQVLVVGLLRGLFAGVIKLRDVSGFVQRLFLAREFEIAVHHFAH